MQEFSRAIDLGDSSSQIEASELRKGMPEEVTKSPERVDWQAMVEAIAT